MIIGVPSEVKEDENRVGLTPAGVGALLAEGHRVLLQNGAGKSSGFDDKQYISLGAQICKTAQEVWRKSELIVKVKEPVSSEWEGMRKGQILFTYLHMAASRELTEAIIDSSVVALAYETVGQANGELPLLTPMSEVAGRMSVQAGTRFLEMDKGGSGILMGGVPGVAAGKVVIIGGGTVGMNAAIIAAGLGARVVVLDSSLSRLRHLDRVMPQNVEHLYSTREAIKQEICDADLVIGAVLLPGAKAPRVLYQEDLKTMREGSVLVDVSVDQGGCFETIHPTSHSDPVYCIDGILHYGVTNIPGIVPRTSTPALTNSTLPYISAIAGKGWEQACREDLSLRAGLNAVDGSLTYRAIADNFGIEHVDPEILLGVNF